MLTNKNKFIIPTRFNKSRDDIYLTMRSRAYFGAGLQGAQAFISAKYNGLEVTGSKDNPNFFIDTKTNIFMTEQGYDQLGTFSKMTANSVFTNASKKLEKIGINELSNNLNAGFIDIQKASRVNDIVSGSGGQIQLKGFDRNTKLDSNYSASDSERLQDAQKNIDVQYYMYTSGNSNVDVKTDKAPNGHNLYSPNVSDFKIETTRPYFSKINNEVYLGDSFDETLGKDSFSLTEPGILEDGEQVSLDSNRIRVRISLDKGKNYSERAYKISDLQEVLHSSEFNNKELTLAYTYIATDSKDTNIGLLPEEINNNTGAYAVPFIRTFFNKQVVKSANVIAKYVDTTGKIIANNVIISGNVGDKYTTEQKNIDGYTFKSVEGNTSGELTDTEQVVTYVYTKNPVKPVKPTKPVEPTTPVEPTKQKLPSTGYNSQTIWSTLATIISLSLLFYWLRNRK